MEFVRGLWRTVAIAGMIAVALIDFAFNRYKGRRERAAWMCRWAKRAIKIADFQVKVIGQPATSGLIVSNHTGYLDVLVLGSLTPTVLVSKLDVKHWPMFGKLTEAAGTIYVDRSSRLATADVTEQMKAAINDGLPVVLFAEGTSSDGETILPFRTSLFEAPVATGAPMHAYCLKYYVSKGEHTREIVRNRITFWGDMDIASHLPKMLGIKQITATVEISPVEIRAENRKDAAQQAEELVRGMHDGVQSVNA